ncbi:MarR family winged helix-turn-helix transcriptional regulator [Novosphingobium sp. PY1]|uniref:MarR family winged helix-turn-helix transcriptional regulator n=1 Tax=Novosphingobium sp. PY1 TaxID=1882221 RepID=UPI000BE77A66|nr:MarR family winged helix-turn-helix transcriptional regulator [Novosphingobium sp. PY1]BBA74029.1 hypothetical protein [Novosphingobium sp. PY1]GFM31266.1 uncharacterized protein PY1_contig_16_207 [Novosphingobium sp. PY1]
MPSKPLPLDPQQSAGYQVRRCHRRFDRLLNACLAPHGLKTGYWYYLRILWIEDGLTQRALSHRTNVTENTTASIINAMVKDGLVKRMRDAQDKRKQRIVLTDRGRALEAELMHYAVDINLRALEGIDRKEIDTCLSVLNRMSENLARAFDDPDGKICENDDTCNGSSAD